MGIVVRFPDEKRMAWNPGARMKAEPAAVVILPVIRIERHAEEAPGGAPEAGAPRGRGRHRPGRRS